MLQKRSCRDISWIENEKVELQFDNNNELEDRLFEELDLPEEKLKDIDRE